MRFLNSLFSRHKPANVLLGSWLLVIGGFIVFSLYTWVPFLLHEVADGNLHIALLQDYLSKQIWNRHSLHDIIHINLRHHIMTVVAVLIVPGLVLRYASASFLSRYIFAGATALSLAYIRILVSTILFVAYCFEPFSQQTIFPAAHVANMDLGILFNWIPQTFPGLFDQQAFWHFWRAFLLLVLFCFLVGWRTRLIGPLVAIMVFVTESWLRGYTGYFNHQHLVSMYVVVALAFFPSGDTMSVDNMRRKRLGRAIAPLTPGAAYAWGRFFVFLIIGLAYMEAGLSKLMHQGWGWPAGKGIFDLSLHSSVSHTNFNFWLVHWDLPMEFYTILGIGTLVFELLAPLVLFWHASRWVLPFAISAMHLGILLFMHILFNDLIFLPFVLLPVETIYLRLTHRSASLAASPFSLAINWHHRIRLGIATCLCILSLLLVRFQTEWFPFTAFQMFSFHLHPEFPMKQMSFAVTDSMGQLKVIPGDEVPPILAINQRFVLVPYYLPEKQEMLMARFKSRFYPDAQSISILVRAGLVAEYPRMSAYQTLVTYPPKP